MRIFRRTILESPFSVPTPDGIARNLRYCRAAMRDSLLQGDAPMVSHALYTQPGVLDDTNPTERAMGIEAGLTWGDAAVATVVYCDLGITPGMRQGIERAAKEQRPVEFRSLAGWTVAGEVASVSTATVAAATTTVTSSPMTDAAPERVDVIGFHAPRLLAAKRARYERNLPDYPDPRTLSCEFCSAVEGAPCTEIVTWWCSDNCARHLIASAPGKCPCGARLVPSEPSVHPTRPLGRPFGHHTPHKGKRSTKAPKPDAAPIQSTPPPEEIVPHVVVTPRKTLRGRANVTLTAPTTATVAPTTPAEPVADTTDATPQQDPYEPPNDATATDMAVRYLVAFWPTCSGEPCDDFACQAKHTHDHDLIGQSTWSHIVRAMQRRRYLELRDANGIRANLDPIDATAWQVRVHHPNRTKIAIESAPTLATALTKLLTYLGSMRAAHLCDLTGLRLTSLQYPPRPTK